MAAAAILSLKALSTAISLPCWLFEFDACELQHKRLQRVKYILLAINWYQSFSPSESLDVK